MSFVSRKALCDPQKSRLLLFLHRRRGKFLSATHGPFFCHMILIRLFLSATGLVFGHRALSLCHRSYSMAFGHRASFFCHRSCLRPQGSFFLPQVFFFGHKASSSATG